jgi:hypothetical protein
VRGAVLECCELNWIIMFHAHHSTAQRDFKTFRVFLPMCAVTSRGCGGACRRRCIGFIPTAIRP